VILGGSAIRGEPEPAFSAGRFLQAMLEEVYPDRRVEVINTGIPAISSHVVLPIAREVAARLEPDVMVVYMGNNEVMGPFGAGTVFAPLSPNLGMIRMSLWLKTTRVGQLCADILGANSPEPEGQWPGLAAFMEQTVGAQDPGLQSVYRHYRRNLADIIGIAGDAGVPVVVSTMAVNLTDCAPFASRHGQSLSPEDTASWRDFYRRGVTAYEMGELEAAEAAFVQAAGIDPTYAELRYRLARCAAVRDDRISAEAHLVAARNYDVLRLRADERINQIIRDVAARAGGLGVTLVDAEAAFRSHRSPGLFGRDAELFYEHVHFRPEGNYLLARALLRGVVEAVGESPRPPQVPSFATCAARLGLGDWDRHEILDPVLTITGRAPFTNQFDHGRRREALLAERKRLRGATTAGATRAAIARYRRALAVHADDLFLHERMTSVLLSAGQFDQAIRHARVVLKRLPGHTDIKLNLAVALAQAGNWPETHVCFSDYLADRQRQHHTPHQLASDCLSAASICLRYGRTSDALAYCQKALAFSPDYPEALVMFGRLQQSAGKPDAAAEAFRRATAVAPEGSSASVAAHRNLSALLLGGGRPDEALRYLRVALSADRRHVPTLLQAATAYGLIRDFAQAAAVYGQAVDVEPQRAGLRQRYADALQLAGRFQQARGQYEQVLQQEPNNAAALGALAWLLATAPDASVRDPSQAVTLARRAVDRRGGGDPGSLDTLAAAHAAAGEFSQAVVVAEQALAGARRRGLTDLAADISGRLAFYQRREPFVQARSAAGP